jgi:hypothetical protein
MGVAGLSTMYLAGQDIRRPLKSLKKLETARSRYCTTDVKREDPFFQRGFRLALIQ